MVVEVANERVGMLKKTPFYKEHVKMGAIISPFAGWHLPSHYPGGASREHQHVRVHCGIFDVSHMGQIILSGTGADAYLDRLVPSDLSALSEGKSRYSCLLNHQGGVMDDVVISKVGTSEFMLCVNASRVERVYEWMCESCPQDCEVRDDSDRYGLMAIQGPKSFEVVSGLLEASEVSGAAALAFCECLPVTIKGTQCLLSRSGYTGEIGYELYLPSEPSFCEWVWQQVMASSKVMAVGLSARNTLRLEAGLLLYGADITEARKPDEVGLGWLVSAKKREYFGASALRAWRSQRASNVGRLHGFLMEKGIARPQMQVCSEAKDDVGEVTSGTYLPTLGKAGGLAFLNKGFDNQTKVLINVRGKWHGGRIAPLPFYESKAKHSVTET